MLPRWERQASFSRYSFYSRYQNPAGEHRPLPQEALSSSLQRVRHQRPRDWVGVLAKTLPLSLLSLVWCSFLYSSVNSRQLCYRRLTRTLVSSQRKTRFCIQKSLGSSGLNKTRQNKTGSLSCGASQRFQDSWVGKACTACLLQQPFQVRIPWTPSGKR